ncbi:hypothetical protein FACS1894181_02740 [Bacteroidia bacterium]|nr:hypothetical protein FACS1894181_02740 [Bacteroidia bacterium]
MQQEGAVKRIFDDFVRRVGVLLAGWREPGSSDNVWLHNATIEKQVEKLLSELHANLAKNIEQNSIDAWNRSNRKTDEIARAYIAGMALPEIVKDGMFSHSEKAMKAFMGRIGGSNLSGLVWDISGGAKENIEYYLSSGIATGRPAALISRDIRQLLKEPDKRFRRVRDKNGKLTLSKPMQDYHPGTGRYRSSYKNALRLAATSTNMSCHAAENERWQKLGFVTGQEIRRSPSAKEPCPICDALAGIYPKEFVFLAWHPFCICQPYPVMLEGEEFIDYLLSGKVPESKFVRDIPEPAKEFIRKNAGRIKNAPWVKENLKFVHLQGLKGNKVNELNERIAESRKEYQVYDATTWKRDYFDERTGGYLVTHKQRIEHSTMNKNEKEKFNKEFEMSLVFARNGYKIEMLKERSGVSSSDITINGIMADLKKTSSHNNIMSYAKKANRRQGAKIVLFEFEKETMHIKEELKKLKAIGIQVKYFFSNNPSKIIDL